ncbi:MAG: c-type cytochrome biogenesis protein CcmI, partial [Ectothiorhodospira sp.]
MTTGFWIGASALALMAVTAVIWPWLNRRREAAVEARGLNLTIYRQRLAELDRERDAGLIDTRQHEITRRELEDNLAADLSAAGDPGGDAGGDRRGGLLLIAV